MPVLRALFDEVVDGLRAGAERVGVSNMHSPRAMFSDTWCSFSRVAYVADLSVGSGVGICVHGRNRAGQLPARFQKTVDSGSDDDSDCEASKHVRIQTKRYLGWNVPGK